MDKISLILLNKPFLAGATSASALYWFEKKFGYRKYMTADQAIVSCLCGKVSY